MYSLVWRMHWGRQEVTAHFYAWVDKPHTKVEAVEWERMSECESLGRMESRYKGQRGSEMTNDQSVWKTGTALASSVIRVSSDGSCCEKINVLRCGFGLR